MAKESVAQNNIWKWLVFAAVTIGAVWLAYPPREKIRLGLDLKGGNSFTLGVDYARLHDKIIESKPELANDPEALEAEVKRTLESKDFDDRMIEIIRRRVDAMGTNEPLIQSVKGKHQIVVQLPGADQKTGDEARERLQKMAYLEFRFVPENEDELLRKIPANACPPGFVASGDGYIKAKDWKTVSTNANYLTRLSSFGTTDRSVRFILEPVKDAKTGRFSYYKGRYVEKKVQLTGDSLALATPDSNHGSFKGGYCVSFELKREAAARFSELTATHIGRQLAIILDDELVSSPVIQSEIGRNGQITGSFTLEEAKALASDLNAGALPAPLKIDSESKVDPTVGRDAISSGIQAAIIGFVLVALFMIFYYWYLGVIANVALLLDVILLPTALFLVAHILGAFVEDPSMAGAKVQLPVLTMPGIAGLVLTLGMAVDANVLIFERIREEFQRGAAVGKAVENGYARAFTAIFDSNITTIITGCILYSVGTGPVRGFAIMLTGGVIISMFTAIVVTRLIIDHTTTPESGKPFRMRQFFKAPSINFMAMGRKTVIASSVIILVSLAIFGIRLKTNPGSVLAVDLTGGTSIIYGMEGDMATIENDSLLKTLRSVLEPIDNAMVIQRQGGDLFLKTGLASDPGTTVVFDIASGADKFSAKNTKAELAKFDPNGMVFVSDFATKVDGGKTNSVGVVKVKVSETSASQKGRTLAASGSSVVKEVERIVTSCNPGAKFAVAADKGSETIGVESRIEEALNGDKRLGGVKFTVKSAEIVGPSVGADLRESGTKAVLLSLVAILIYVGFRFRFGFGLGGLVALAHDALISLGLFSLCGRQVSLIVITALLTIIGYSINDTVVVFDRIRELLQREKRLSFAEVCNKAINECLSRTVITSVTTFFAVAALFIFGDGSIYDFALTMLIGVVAGTYSSMFIATPVMFWWYRGRRPDVEEEKEGEQKPAIRAREQH